MPEHMTTAQVRALKAKVVIEPEAVVIDQCRQYLRATGWFVVRIQQGMGCHRGIADLYCLKDGRDVWVECKATKGKQSEYQKNFEHAIRVNGGEYFVAHSLDELIEKVRV
jgi:hypothetical protein